MHKTTIYLPDETKSEIKLAARFEGRSEASISITAMIAHGERAHTIASGRS